MPKYLIQASYSHEGFEGVRTKGGSSRRAAVAETARAWAGSSKRSTSRSATTTPS